MQGEDVLGLHSGLITGQQVRCARRARLLARCAASDDGDGEFL